MIWETPAPDSPKSRTASPKMLVLWSISFHTFSSADLCTYFVFDGAICYCIWARSHCERSNDSWLIQCSIIRVARQQEGLQFIIAQIVSSKNNTMFPVPGFPTTAARFRVTLLWQRVTSTYVTSTFVQEQYKTELFNFLISSQIICWLIQQQKRTTKCKTKRLGDRLPPFQGSLFWGNWTFYCPIFEGGKTKEHR